MVDPEIYHRAIGHAIRSSHGIEKIPIRSRRTETILKKESFALFTVSKSVGRLLCPVNERFDAIYSTEKYPSRSIDKYRTVHAHYLFHFGGNLYVYGYCEVSKKDRTFRADRFKLAYNASSSHKAESPFAFGPSAFGISIDAVRIDYTDFFVRSEDWGRLRRPMAILLRKMMDRSYEVERRFEILGEFADASLEDKGNLSARQYSCSRGLVILALLTDLRGFDWKSEHERMRGGRFDKAAFAIAMNKIDESKS